VQITYQGERQKQMFPQGEMCKIPNGRSLTMNRIHRILGQGAVQVQPHQIWANGYLAQLESRVLHRISLGSLHEDGREIRPKHMLYNRRSNYQTVDDCGTHLAIQVAVSILIHTCYQH
jgi:hypothetical protein